MMNEQWYEFAGGNWQQEVDVRDFILKTIAYMTVTTLS